MSDSEQLFNQANLCVVDEDYERAAQLYDQSIDAARKAGVKPSLQMFVARASNSIKRKQYQAALQDADAALAADDQSNKQSMSQAHFRRGQALFFLDRFTEAKSAFEQAQSLGHNQAELQIRKCDAEIKRQPSKPAQTATQSTSAPAAASSVPLATKVKEQWFQNKTHVTITLFARDLPADGISVKLENGVDLSASVKCKDGSVFEKQWRLFAAVNAEIKTDLTAYRLEIILTKVEAADWLGLVEEEKAKLGGAVARENVINENITPHYPTSSKKKVEWSEVEETAKKIEEEDEKPTGDAAFHKFMKTLYKDADEDTRRAMIKSYQTSGGTVLNMNWKDVKKTDYTKDRKAPDGQEFADMK